MTPNPDKTPAEALRCEAWLGLLGNYATAEDVEAEKKHFDESTPLEIVTISAILKGLEEYAQETANDEMADGFTGEEASGRAHAYYETRERIQAYWPSEERAEKPVRAQPRPAQLNKPEQPQKRDGKSKSAMTEELLKRIRALAANDEGIGAEGTRRLIEGYDALQARVERLELCNRELQTLIDNEGYPSGVDYDSACAERDSLRLQLNSLRTSYDFLANKPDSATGGRSPEVAL